MHVSTLPNNPFDRVRTIRSRAQGFDEAYGYNTFNNIAGTLKKEIKELESTVENNEPSSRQLDEFGDVLYVASRLGLIQKLNPEDALNSTCDKVSERFDIIENLAKEDWGTNLDNLTQDQCRFLWQKAKKIQNATN